MRTCILIVYTALMGLVPIAQADQRFQDWAFSKESYAQEAFTRNASGELLGVLCFLSNQKCIAYFTTTNQCVEGRKVPVLINADTGASLYDTTCEPLDTGNGRIWVNVFDDASITDVMLKASNIGIAIPLEQGLFKAVRFSLMGSNEAIAKARTLPPGARPAKGDSEVF